MIRGVGLVPNWQKKYTEQTVKKIISYFDKLAIPVYLAPKQEQEPFLSLPFPIAEFQTWGEKLDLVIVLGGDGTILRASRELCATTIPMLGINLGRKGFLAEVDLQDLQPSLDNLIAGNFKIAERMMLHCQVLREEKCLAQFDCLNDVIVSRGPFSRIIRLDTYVNNVFFQRYSGDGIIISSPTGSTGYSLSAGGPIVNPSLEILIVTPICPYLLHNRAVLVSGEDRISMNIKTKDANIFITIDGQEGIPLKYNDVIEVRKSRYIARLISFPEANYYKLLQQKLMKG